MTHFVHATPTPTHSAAAQPLLSRATNRKAPESARPLAGMLLAGRIQKLLGVIGMHVITRIMGVLLSALAIQFIFDGIAQSGLLPS